MNSEPLATPAVRAMTAVGAPSPWLTITRVAAAKIAFRLSSLRGLAISAASPIDRSLITTDWTVN